MVTDLCAFHATSIGASHIKSGTVCQDCSWSVDTENYRLAVVCDGHGGADYFRSDRGSRFAVDAFTACADHADFLDALSDVLTKKQQRERLLQFIKSVILRWNTLVDEDIAAYPFADDELEQVSEKAKKRYLSGKRLQSAYGTTLIGIVITDKFWFGIQIGDGKCVAVDENGHFTQPIPWDQECFLNVTTSLCDSDACAEFRYYFSRTIPLAVFIGSDGVDDCFAGSEKLYDFYRVTLQSLSAMAFADACKQLAEYLPSLSAGGSGDDMSVGFIINLPLAQQKSDLFNSQKKIFLQITHDGNFGGEKPSDTYFQTAEIEAVPGIYALSELDCGGLYNMSRKEFEILSVCAQSVVMRLDDTEYIITPESPTEITKTETETAYDGPRFTAYDTLEFLMTEK